MCLVLYRSSSFLLHTSCAAAAAAAAAAWQGRDAAASLMDHIKVGGIVLVKGRVQQNPAASKGQPSGSSSSSSNRVLDVVAHEVVLLHRNRDMLAKAIRAAQRSGAVDVTTAAQLLQLQQQQEQQQWRTDAGSMSEQREVVQQRSLGSASNATNGAGPISSSSNTASHLAVTQLAMWLMHETSRTAGDSSTARLPRSRAARIQQAEPALSSPPAATAAAAVEDAASDVGKYWQLPADIASSIHWVCDEQGIANMQQLVLPQATTDSASSSGVPGTVVGLDCEWRPYDKHSAATPVALLQLATRRHVFLVDLLAICQQQQQQPVPCSENSGSNGDSSRLDDLNSSSTSRSAVTPAERVLSAFLLSLLCEPRVVKVGFQLGTDLDRLQVRRRHSTNDYIIECRGVACS
jgi:hypothetical protein